MGYVSNLIRRAGWPLLIVLASVVLLRQIGDSSLAKPDADRLLLDGLFMLDFLKQFPHWMPSDVYKFTTEYYAQYPGLSVGYKPVFFPLIEGIANAVLGISTASARLALLGFGLAGLAAWFKLIARRYDHATAFWSCALLVTLPTFAQWGWYTMTELPTVSMVMITGYLFDRYLATEQSRYLYFTALAFGLACWTKQVAVFAVVWLFFAALASGKLFALVTKREFWISVGIALALLLPLAVVTLWLGELNMAQSLGRAASQAHSVSGNVANGQREAIAAYLTRPFHVFAADVPLPFFLLAWLGVGLALVRRDSAALYFGLMLLSVYLFFGLFLGIGRARDYLYWLPAFALFAALPVHYLRLLGSETLQRAAAALLALVVASQLVLIYAKQPKFSTGYDLVARYVVARSSSPTIFFDGYNNGYFTYFVRLADADRSFHVLRGDKLLTSSGMYAEPGRELGLEVLAKSREDIASIFDRYGVEYVVVESKSPLAYPIHDDLRAYLKSEKFIKELEIPIETNRSDLAGQSLQVFRNLNVKQPESGWLEIRVPIVGKTIRVPFSVKGNKSSAGGAAADSR